MSNTRRQFVKTAAALGLASVATGKDLGAIPKRRFGATDMEVAILGLGGARFGNLSDEQQALSVIRRARELGVNYFDTAAAGAYGVSQRRYGTAFGTDNKDIYYGTKTRHRTFAHSELDLNQSLNHLKRDYIDLYQVHNVMHDEDIEFIFGPRGVMEMIEKAKKDGKIRHVGFTGHMDPLVLEKIMGLYDWDTVLMPLSVTDGAREGFSFEQTTLSAAVKKGLGIQAMKTTGVGAIEKEKISSIEESLNYVWSLPISVAILGCSTIEELETDARIAVATEQNRLSESARTKIRNRWAKADFARLEPWKVDHSSRNA